MARWQCMNCGYIYKGAAPPPACPSCGAPFTAFVKLERDARARLRGVRIESPRPPGYRYVIVGNSSAGRSAARAIRALDGDGRITVLSEEPTPLYFRPVLPDFIGGLDRETFLGMGSSAFESQGLDILLGERVEGLDPAAKQVTCAGGRAIPYDALLLATGSSPVQVPWPGSEAEGIAYFRTLADAERLAELTADTSRAVVVGGGLLGLEFVRAFLAAKLQVTHLVRGRRVGAPALDEQGGALVEGALRDLGVDLALEEEVAGFESAGGRVCGVRTSKDRVIECDLVGVAVGVRPRVELAREAGLEVDRGVLVDRRMMTSAPDVYAAGDVAQAYDRLWDGPRVNTSWRNSQEQGEFAGIAMAGGAGEYAGAVAANYQLAAGLPFCALGVADPPEAEGYEAAVEVDERARTCRKLITRSGTLVGACFIGDLSEAAEVEQKLRATGASAPPPAARTTPQPRGPVPPSERPSAMHKMTEQHLKEAFAGESQAHLKYRSFAERAEEEGKANVARLLKAASYSEQVHATRHLEVLEGVGSTAENLAGAVAGEGFEIDEMYPAYIAVAVEQDEPEAQETFNHALETEKVHRELYQRAKGAVAAGGDAAIETLWVCNYCGFTMEGEPPDQCPLCGNLRKNFVKF